MNRNDRGRHLVKLFKQETIGRALQNFRRVPYADDLLAQAPTFIADQLGRVVIARSQIARWQLDLMPQFIEEASLFVQKCQQPFDLQAMQQNSRGSHWFSICGHDRNNKTIPALSKFHKDNEEAINWFFRKGSPMSRISQCASSFVEIHFPGVAQRFQKGITLIDEHYGVKAMYGLFFNFCLNVSRPGQVDRVHCLPHADYKNLALAVCVVFVYGEQAGFPYNMG
ncbi:hypothetical protein BD626DRAFT_541371 [Schizophyllum amplum]|uniref:Uncharacterized protein n=1 Tax=Schizophyllum amplum TaxID=97359 RepID=A0A550BUX0_9AGAR|nr:hypothetical protein BD626DRAFT_541371 [Auriculariopsis ampla]